MRLDRRSIPALILALAFSLPVAGQDTGLGDPRLEPVFHPLSGNVEVLRLENGLEVLLMRNPAQPMVGIYTQVRVGSAREDYRTSGMSHMLEHLLFNGTGKYTQEDLYDLADNAGAYNNANTADFFTNFMLVVPAAELETGLDLQSQMLFHSIVPGDKFLKEQGIVLGELVAARDRPGHFSETAMRQVLFQGSSLELPTLGTRATIEHMTRDDVYAFYKRWYVPNNMIVTIAGNFDRDRTVELLEQYYGSVAPGTLPDEDFRAAAPIDGAATVARRGGDRRLAALSFQAPGYGMDDFFPFLVMTEMLTLEGSGILTRVIDDLDQDARPELSVWWDRAPGFSRLNLEFDLPEGADPARMYPLVQDALTGALEAGLTGEDILGIARMSETQTLLEREQLRMTGIFIAEPLVLGGPDFFLSYLDRLREVTAEDVTRVMTNWLIDAPCLGVLIEPDPQAAAGSAGAGMPPGMQMPAGTQMPPAMAAAMQKMAAGGGTTKPGAAETPAVVEPAPLKVDRSVLANGAVLVSQTNPDSPLQAIHLAVRGRALIDRDEGGAGALDVVHRLVEEGVAGCDRTCLARRLRRLGAVVKLVDDGRIPMDDYYTNGRFSFIRVETAAGNGPEVLELLTEMVRHGVFAEDVFERVRAERITELGRDQASARTVANGMLAGALYGDHPLVLPPEGSAETLAGLDYDRIRTVYRRAFTPENLVFSIIGPAGHEELKEAIERLLPGQGVPGPGIAPLPVTVRADSLGATLGGEMAAIRLGSILQIVPEDETALSLAVAILSDRMAMDLREARGLSYSVGASLDAAGDRAEFTAWINPPLERSGEALEALRAFVAGFDAATITQEEADKIRSASRGRTLMRRLSSMGQAYYLAMAELEGDIPGYLQALNRYEDVTLGDLRRVSDRYLKTMTLVTVVVD